MKKCIAVVAALAAVAVVAAQAFAGGGLALTAALAGNGTGVADYEERLAPGHGVDWKLKVAAAGIVDTTPRQAGPDRVLDVYAGGHLVGSMLIRKHQGTMTAEQRGTTSVAAAGTSLQLLDHADGSLVLQGVFR